jgi:hypothetical protein
MIDPRGLSGAGDFDSYGDSRYDVAKLFHSVFGKYDLIIAGRYRLEGSNIIFLGEERRWKIVEDSFVKNIADRFDLSQNELIAMSVQLFLSMLPLHSDRPDRQRAFICNAYRLFKQITRC